MYKTNITLLCKMIQIFQIVDIFLKLGCPRLAYILSYTNQYITTCILTILSGIMAAALIYSFSGQAVFFIWIKSRE